MPVLAEDKVDIESWREAECRFCKSWGGTLDEYIAREAVSMAGLSSDRCLRGWKIIRAISAAKSIRAQMLRPAAEQDDDDAEAENGDALNDPNLMIKA